MWCFTLYISRKLYIKRSVCVEHVSIKISVGCDVFVIPSHGQSLGGSVGSNQSYSIYAKRAVDNQIVSNFNLSFERECLRYETFGFRHSAQGFLCILFKSNLLFGYFVPNCLFIVCQVFGGSFGQNFSSLNLTFKTYYLAK